LVSHAKDNSNFSSPTAKQANTIVETIGNIRDHEVISQQGYLESPLQEMRKVWWTLEELTDNLHCGGVDSKIPVGFVERALKFDRSGVVAPRRDNNKKFYLTGEGRKAHFSTARDQIASIANGFALPKISRCLLHVSEATTKSSSV
jgi:hypothetical protein